MMAAKKKSTRGRKTCPACGETTGARTRTCKCGHEFQIKTHKQSVRGPLDYSLEELENLVKAKKAVAEPLAKLIEKHGAEVVLAEAQRLAQ